MFSQWLGERDELFKFISAPCEQPKTMQKENQLLLGNVNVVCPSLIISNADHSTKKPKTRGRRRKLTTGPDIADLEESPKEYIRKIIHRDVERQRRQEMAGLYHTLRSIIPPQHLQGKRSISNHIHLTAKYIKHMKNKIDGLNKKRDKLKKSLNTMNPSSNYGISIVAGKPGSSGESDRRRRPIITVKTFGAGEVEITANIDRNGDHPSLSKILKVLISEGMSIKSCTSSRVHDRQLHVIHSEVEEGKIIDPDGLCKKLRW